MRHFFFVWMLVVAPLLHQSCEHPAPAFQQGEALALTHCSTCHTFPDPSLLDQNTWKNIVLPRMGILMGHLPEDSAGGIFYEPELKSLILQNPGIWRESSALSQQEWSDIRNYYLKAAPPSVPMLTQPIDTHLLLFEVKFPDLFADPPGTSLVQFSGNQCYYGDIHSEKLFRLDQKLLPQGILNIPGGPVHLTQLEEGQLITAIGSFTPSDQSSGSILFVPKDASAALTLIDQLKRPVHTSVGDLDQDGLFDLVICEFGKWAGSLNWWKNDGKGHFEKKLLRNMPGAISTIISDLNGDRLPDIVALFGQGDEGIFLYENLGQGNFNEKRLLSFPPSYGSSFFQLSDFDQDGLPDILYTCGDQADFKPVLKPYHGIRWYKNTGNYQFEEVFFYPLPGAYGAVMEDFDQDGDLDAAAISFFPDYHSAKPLGFVYLENLGNGRPFKARTFPQVDKGRWMLLHPGDYDADGDIDLILGNLSFPTVPEKNWENTWQKFGIPFLILENQLVQHK